MDYIALHIDEGGKIVHAMHMDCDGDDAALERAALIHTPHALELWQSGRLVWRFEPPLRV